MFNPNADRELIESTTVACDPDLLAVCTTNGERFGGEEVVRLALMIWRRFGRRLPDAASAWRRLHGNNCEDAAFGALVVWGMLHGMEG